MAKIVYFTFFFKFIMSIFAISLHNLIWIVLEHFFVNKHGLVFFLLYYFCDSVRKMNVFRRSQFFFFGPVVWLKPANRFSDLDISFKFLVYITKPKKEKIFSVFLSAKWNLLHCWKNKNISD